MMRVFLSLCSGHSGESEAFINEPGWVVVRIEKDDGLSHIPNTRILDVLKWLDWIDSIPQPVEVVWASPPCQEFSAALGPRRVENPSMEILKACMDIIAYLKPKYWLIENVRGAIQHFHPLLDAPSQVIGPFYLWGKFPHIDIHVRYAGQAWFPHAQATPKTRGDGHWLLNGIKYNKWDTPNRACIPFEISKRLLEAVNQQTTLELWTV